MSAPEVLQGKALMIPREELDSSVTVIVVNFHAGSCLLECVRSALVECGEIVIVDNSANDMADRSVQLVREVFRGDSRVMVLPQLQNLGFAAACNIGVGAAAGDYLLFLNPDCVLHSHSVGEMLATLQANPRAAMAGGLLLNPDGSEQAGGRRAGPTPWRSFVRAFGLKSLGQRYPKLFADYDLHRLPLPVRAEPVEAISGACMLVRKAALEEIGLLDEGYFMHCEDLDWCMRFRQAGKEILFVPSARVVHEKGACSHARPVFVEWHKHKGMLRFYRSHFRHQYPGLLMWLVMLGVGLRFVAVASLHLVRGLRRRLGWVRATA